MAWEKASDEDRQPLIDDFVAKMQDTDESIYAFVQVRPIEIKRRSNTKEGQAPTFLTRDVNISYKAPESDVYRDLRVTLWHEKAGEPGDLLAVLFAPPPGTTRKSANVKVQMDPEYLYGDVNPQTGRIYWKYDAKEHRVLLGKPREQDMSQAQKEAWAELGHDWIDLYNGDGYSNPALVPEFGKSKMLYADPDWRKPQEQPEPVAVVAGVMTTGDDDGLEDW